MRRIFRGEKIIAGKGADLNLNCGVGAAPYAQEMDCARLNRAFEAVLSEGQKWGGKQSNGRLSCPYGDDKQNKAEH